MRARLVKSSMVCYSLYILCLLVCLFVKYVACFILILFSSLALSRFTLLLLGLFYFLRFFSHFKFKFVRFSEQNRERKNQLNNI